MEANILDGKYTVSLDAIDVNLLTIQKFNEKHSEDIASLWSIGNLAARYNEFYEFEAFFDGTGIQHENSDSECLENNIKFTCHICNIDVPKSYLKEHNSGNKHKTCSAIAEHALDRIKQHLAQGIDTPSAKTNTSTYFCEPCALVVRVNNKANHEKSKEHAISVKHDKLINDLLIIYIDNKKCYDLEIGNAKIVRELDNNDDDFEKADATVKENDEKHNKIQKPADTSTTDDATPQVCKEKIPETKIHEIALAADEKKDLKEYIKILSHINNDQPKHSLSAVDEDYIEIKTISGHRVKVSVDNFHGFFSVEDYVQCRVCKVMVEDKETHKMIPDHMEKVAAPIKNKHCVRQINEIWNHCILCNQIIENIDFHVQSNELHTFLLIDAVIKSTKDPDNENRNVLNTHTLANTNNLKESGSDSKINLKGAVNKDLQVTNTTKTIVNEEKKVMAVEIDGFYIMEITKNPKEVTCKACKVTLPNTKDNIKGHINGLRHISNYNLAMASNKLKKVGDKFFCECCKLYVTKTQEFAHLDNSIHKNNLKKVTPASNESNSVDAKTLLAPAVNNVKHEMKTQLQAKNQITEPISNTTNNLQRHYMMSENFTNPKQLICKVCKVYVPYLKRNIDEHVTGFNHCTTYATFLTENKLQSINNKIYCQACDVNVKQNSEFEHINDGVHKTNVIRASNDDNNKRNVPNLPGKNNVLANKYDEKTSLPNTQRLHHLMSLDTKNPKQVICKICNCNITINQLNVDGHLKGSNHTNNYNTILIKNKLNKVNDKIYCEICKVYVPQKEELNHIKNSTHITSLSKNGVTNERTNTIVLNAKPELHFMMFEDTKNPSQIWCKVCNVIVPKTTSNVRDHINGSIHSNNYKSILSKNKLKMDNGKIYCELCNSRGSETTVFKHINSDIHKRNYLNKDASSEAQANIISNEPKQTLKPPDTSRILENSKGNNELLKAISNVNEHAVKTQSNNHATQNVADNSINQKKPTNDNVKNIATEQTKIKCFMETTDNPKELNCKICNSRVPFTNDLDTVHIEGSKHKSKYKSILEVNRLKNIADGYYCNVCTCFVQISHEYNHICDETHKANLVNYCQPSSSRIAPNIETEIVSESEVRKQDEVKKIQSEPNELVKVEQTAIVVHYLMQKTNDNQFVCCKVCKALVPSKSKYIYEHVTSPDHNAKFDFILNENSIKKTNDPQGLQCVVCKLYLQYADAFDHINDENHKINKSDIVNTKLTSNASKAEEFCDVGETNVENMEAHLANDVYFCEICQSNVTNNAYAIQLHEQGSRHVLTWLTSKIFRR